MNKIYRLVWNHARQCLVAVSETARSRSKAPGARKAIVEAVAGAVLALGAGQALAANACASGTGTVTMAATDDCILVPGETLTATASSSAVVVPGVSVGQINNGGTIEGLGTSLTTGAIQIQNGSSVTGGILNTGSILGGSAGGAAFIIGGSTIGVGITNSGLIDGGTGQAMFIGDGTQTVTIAGDFVNQLSGTIDGDKGITFFNGANALNTITGSFINAGEISPSLFALRFGNVKMASFTNSATGTISAGEAVQILGSGVASTITGDFSNYGLIEGTSGAGVNLEDDTLIGGRLLNATGATISGANAGLFIAGVTINGGIVNQGLLQGGDEGLYYSVASTVNLTNSGTIRGSNGIYFYAYQETITGSILNQAGGLIDGTSEAGIYIYENSHLSGSIINAGTIQGGSAGIYITSDSSVGGITNSGLIRAISGPGIFISSASVMGSIVNQAGGTISGSENGVFLSSSASIGGGITNGGLIRGDSGDGLYMETATVAGAIVNLAGGTIRGSNNGIVMSSSSLIGSGITNSGLVMGEGLDGLQINSASTVTGAVVNLAGGTIMGFANGIHLRSQAFIGIGISNSGLIKGDSGNGIEIESSTVVGGITNLAGGTVSGENIGINIKNSAEVNRIVNAGRISVDSPLGVGVLLEGVAVPDGITNSGTISGGLNAVYLKAGTPLPPTLVISIPLPLADASSGPIVNSGLISAASTSLVIAGMSQVTSIANSGRIVSTGTVYGPAIGLFDTSTVTGSLENTGTLSGVTGILAETGAVVTGGVSNSGLIAGSVKSLDLLNTTAFAINNTGTLSGAAIIGLNTLNLNGNSARVIGNVTGVGGTVNVNNTFTSEGTFDVADFNIASGGLFNMQHGVKVSGTATNDGILNVGSGNRSVTGNFVQNGGGTFRMGLTGTTAGSYGVLNVSGTAAVAGKIDVIVGSGAALANETTVAGVIRSSGMTVKPANLVVTDNNLFYEFTPATVTNPGKDLDLLITGNPLALPQAVAPNNPAAVGIAQSLQDIFNAGASPEFAPVFDALSTLSPEEVNKALLQMTPSIQGAGAQAGINALHSMNKIIQSRVESVQGLSSGDETSERYAWGRAFGNWSDQDNHKGVAGFESTTQGLVMGMDKPVTDRIRAGALVTYAHTDLASKFGISTVDVDTYQVAGYASYSLDPRTDINFQLDLGLNQADSARVIGFLGRKAEADFDSFNQHVGLGIGRLFALGEATTVTPSVRLDYTHVATDGYTEQGAGVLNLRVDGDSFNEMLMSVDGKVSHLLTKDGLKLVANATAGYDAIDDRAQANSIFTGGGANFVTYGLDSSPWVFRGGAGLVKETGTGMEFSVRYDTEGRTSGYLNQTASVRVRWDF